MDYRFDAQGLDTGDLQRRMAEDWAALPFDPPALAALRRDGLNLDQVRLGGANPYDMALAEDENAIVRVPDGPAAQSLIDLFQLHFLRRLRVLDEAAVLAGGAPIGGQTRDGARA